MLFGDESTARTQMPIISAHPVVLGKAGKQIKRKVYFPCLERRNCFSQLFFGEHSQEGKKRQTAQRDGRLQPQQPLCKAHPA
jgi:hypothetical protein